MPLFWIPTLDVRERVWLRADSIEPGFFYRMDTHCVGAQGHFDWNLDILEGEGIAVETMGMRVWTERIVDGYYLFTRRAT